MNNTPHWDVSYLNKTTERKGRIGAAWNNDDGTISVVLNPLVVIDAKEDILITLFPKGKTFKPKSKKA